MQTKNFTLLLAAGLLLLACNGKPSETTILTGRFDTKAPESVRIMYGDLDTLVKVDPATQSFRVELPTDVLSFASIDSDSHSAGIILDGTKLNLLFKEGGEVVVTSSSPKKSVQASYDAFAEKMQQLMNQYRADNENIDNNENLSSEEKKARKQNVLDATAEELNDYCRKVVAANGDNILSLVAITNMDVPDEELLTIIDGLGEGVRSMESIQEARAAIEVRMETGEGKMFKDFTIVQDPDDAAASTVSFSDYIGKGKYMLVDFWASWCGPCRGEMPYLKTVYDEFHGEKFDMLSVAVWDKPEASKKAAGELGIEWNQIINAQSIPTDLYGIDGIPQIMLFGPDGTILRRDLRGDAIRAAVAENLQ